MRRPRERQHITRKAIGRALRHGDGRRGRRAGMNTLPKAMPAASSIPMSEKRSALAVEISSSTSMPPICHAWVKDALGQRLVAGGWGNQWAIGGLFIAAPRERHAGVLECTHTSMTAKCSEASDSYEYFSKNSSTSGE